jgi:hypothetical protein
MREGAMTQIEIIAAAEKADCDARYTEKKSNAQLDEPLANVGRGNYTKFGRDYANGACQADAWCCSMQSVQADRAGLVRNVDFPYTASCPTAMRWFKALGLWYKTPKVGDWVLFSLDGGVDSATHVGFVYTVSADGKTIYTYEGNTSSAAGIDGNGGMCAAKSYSVSNKGIGGYGRPNYEIEEDEDMTDEKFAELMANWQKAQGKLGVSAQRAPDEYAVAVDKKITDGTRPQDTAMRQEVAIMVLRGIKYVLAKMGLSL